jgi:hypothetical protein
MENGKLGEAIFLGILLSLILFGICLCQFHTTSHYATTYDGEKIEVVLKDSGRLIFRVGEERWEEYCHNVKDEDYIMSENFYRFKSGDFSLQLRFMAAGLDSKFYIVGATYKGEELYEQ